MSGEDEVRNYAVLLANPNGGQATFGPMTEEEAFDFAGGARALWKLSGWWDDHRASVVELETPALETATMMGFVPVVIEKEPVA
jgi:hypothetical protein